MVAATAAAAVASGVPALAAAPRGRAVGLRLVGLAASVAALLIVILAGLAMVHSTLAAGQYQLSDLEAEIARERERLLDLQLELQMLQGPDEVELMGVGALGLVTAVDPIDLRVEPRHIAAVHRTERSTDHGGDWLAIKSLLTDASTTHDSRR